MFDCPPRDLLGWLASMRNGTRVLFVVTSAAVLAGACGSKSPLMKAQYEQKVNQIGKQLSTTLDNTFSSPKLQHAGSLKETAEVFRVAQKNLEDAANRLDSLRPPEQVTNTHDLLVKGFRDFAHAFGRFARATENGDLSAIQKFNQQVSDQTLPAMIEIQRAIDQLKAKGFDISRG